MITRLASRTGKVLHAEARTDRAATLCNGQGAARGQVRWFARQGEVTCKACLKAIATAEEQAYRMDADRAQQAQGDTAPTALLAGEERVGALVGLGRTTPAPAPQRTRRPQINHRKCSHAQTPAARRQCRNHAAKLPDLARLVDQAHQAVYDANLVEPYNHEDYERCERVLRAALMVFANGDTAYANALRNLLLDSGEPVMYYVNHHDHETIMDYVDRWVSY